MTYRHTTVACYLGNFVQSVVINLTPVLFIPLREQFGMTYAQFGTLVLVNFIVQVLSDIVCARVIDRTGFRALAVWGHALCVVGLILFALAPVLFPGSVYTGFLVATVVAAAAGGLLEVLISPIVHNMPTEKKAGAMAVLHSFYAWGQVVVILLTTLLLFLFTRASWQWIVAMWALLPLANTFLFALVPMPPKPAEHEVMSQAGLWKSPVFRLALAAILFGAASEVTMNQWVSAFLEKGMGIDKLTGDLLGMGVFAVMLGAGRLGYGLWGDQRRLDRLLIFGSLIAIACYVLGALSGVPALALIACGIAGIAVSLMWPGTLVVAAEHLPRAGAALFALMAVSGDIGAAIGPWLTGIVSDGVQRLPQAASLAQTFGQTSEQIALRGGLLLGALFPLATLVCHLLLSKKRSGKVNEGHDEGDVRSL